MPNIIINNYCNQKCSYCFAEDSMTIQKNKYNTQSLYTFLNVLKFLKKYRYNDVRLLGGEPLLNTNINYFINISLRGGFDVLIFSNLNFKTDFLKNIFKNNPFNHKIRINCNLNNIDFYNEIEYKNIKINIKYLIGIGIDVVIGYNVYDLSKNFDDIADLSKELGIKKINLKITNTIFGKELIVDTGSRGYGVYFFDVFKKYNSYFKFEFSCGLDKNIFTQSELDYFSKKGLHLLYGCDGFKGKFDIDIDGSIYKCFPTRDFYLNKNLNIFNYNPNIKDISYFGIKKSKNNCSAHIYSNEKLGSKS